MSWKWLMEKIRGYAALPGPDRDAITTFALLWSLFEAKLMGSQATARKIASAVDQWDAAGGIAAELYDGEVAYFRDLYFQNGEFTFRFDKLQLRKWDNARSYRGLYKGDADTPRARVLTVLLIIWRFRNNLFHGEKWAYDLQGQLENFSHANAVLMRALERHTGLG